MATKDTPKKFYTIKGKEVTAISSCRLCSSIVDPHHAKSLQKGNNLQILKDAEDVYGNRLPKSENLPHLICRPCERRVKNTKQFKNLISETQRSLEQSSRSKRCVELSPSVVKPPLKARTVSQPTGSGRRRSLDFDVLDTQPAAQGTLPRVTTNSYYYNTFYILLCYH